jgi:putative oxidoreductase
MQIGLLIIRVVVGLSLAAYGGQKLFGLFGGHGIAGTGKLMESVGFRPGKLFATVAGLGEASGGIAFAIGLFTPLAAAVIVATMLVAIVAVHLENGFFATNDGYNFELIIAAVATALAFTGPGAVSVDAVAGVSFAGVTWGLIALGLGVLGAVPPLLLRSAAAPGAVAAKEPS